MIPGRSIFTDPRARLNRIDAIPLVDGLPEHQLPTALALHQEVEEPAGADHIAADIVHIGALGDGHLRLSGGPVTRDLDGRAAVRVQDAHAPFPALPADLDELVAGPLEPGGHHPAAGVPDRAEAFPVARIPPQDPVVDEGADLVLVRTHGSPPSVR